MVNCRLISVIALALAICAPAVAADAVKGRAVSLSALQTVLKAGGSKEASRLCGITRVTGYLTDAKTRDVILIGEVDPALPRLYLDDLVTALRNAWMLYATVRGRTHYYSAPGCSIDPNPEVLGRLQQVSASMCDKHSQDELDAALDAWNTIGKQPHGVRVMGVPYDTRFAKVMVDADYYMKRLTNGSVSLGIEGFASLSELTVNQLKDDVAKGATTPAAGMSMSRFWFSPGETTYSEDDDGVVMLKSCEVGLLTEEEFVTTQGKVAGMGRPNPLAKRFAQGFTVSYAAIAEARPIYAELQGLYRFAAIAKLLKSAGTNANLRYLLKAYRVTRVPVSRKLPGLTHVSDFNLSKETEDGTKTLSLSLPTCGGVSMDVRPKRVSDDGGPVAKRPGVRSTRTAVRPSVSARPKPPGIKKVVLAARKSPASLSWDFPVPSKP